MIVCELKTVPEHWKVLRFMPTEIASSPTEFLNVGLDLNLGGWSDS